MPNSLSSWLEYLSLLHPKTIEMGLERVSLVRDKMGLHPALPILMVTGTNGKGSVCAMLESILSHCGFKTGCYTSPHLLRFNERIRIGREEVQDGAICEAFATVEKSRGDTALTYFEFTTLAAMQLFVEYGVDYLILEVGLGGRLDAVNAFDADVAVITSIGLDHMDYLGYTRESVGFEKAGIMRKNKPVICAEKDVPESIGKYAQEIGAKLFLIGRDYGFKMKEDGWVYKGFFRDFSLPFPCLEGKIQVKNAATAIACLEKAGVGLKEEILASALLDIRLQGRFQKKGNVVYDVSHNPQAARVLAANLKKTKSGGRTLAVFSMLLDKDIQGVIREVKDQIDVWYVAPIKDVRGAYVKILTDALRDEGVENVFQYAGIPAAFQGACEGASVNDRIAVFGSFHTVSEVLGLGKNG